MVGGGGLMRTDLTAEIAGCRVRAVVTAAALVEIEEARGDFADVVRRVSVGGVRDIRAVLAACIRAAGELRPAEVETEVARLIEAGGIKAASDFASRLLGDAWDKAETAGKKSEAAAAAGTTAAA